METDRVYSSEEDIKIARLILNYSSDLGFNDPTVVSCKERQNKYSESYEKIHRIFNSGKNDQEKREFSSFCNRFNMIVMELKRLQSPSKTLGDKGIRSSIFPILEEILLKGPILGSPKIDDVDQTDVASKTPVLMVQENESQTNTSTYKPLVSKRIRNDVYAKGISSKQMKRSDTSNQSSVSIDTKSPSTITGPESPVKFTFFNTQPSTRYSAVKRIYQDEAINHPLSVSDEYSLDSSLGDYLSEKMTVQENQQQNVSQRSPQLASIEQATGPNQKEAIVEKEQSLLSPPKDKVVDQIPYESLTQMSGYPQTMDHSSYTQLTDQSSIKPVTQSKVIPEDLPVETSSSQQLSDTIETDKPSSNQTGRVLSDGFIRPLPSAHPSLSVQEQPPPSVNTEKKREEPLSCSMLADLDVAYSVPSSGPVTPVQPSTKPGSVKDPNLAAFPSMAIPSIPVMNTSLLEQSPNQYINPGMGFPSPLYPPYSQSSSAYSYPYITDPQTAPLYSQVPIDRNDLPTAMVGNDPSITAIRNEGNGSNLTGSGVCPKEGVDLQEMERFCDYIPSESSRSSSILMYNCNVEIKEIYNYGSCHRNDSVCDICSLLDELKNLNQEISNDNYTEAQMKEINQKISTIICALDEVSKSSAVHSNLDM